MSDFKANPEELHRGADHAEKASDHMRDAKADLAKATISGAMFGGSAAARAFADKLGEAHQEQIDNLHQHADDLQDMSHLAKRTAQHIVGTDESGGKNISN